MLVTLSIKELGNLWKYYLSFKKCGLERGEIMGPSFGSLV